MQTLGSIGPISLAFMRRKLLSRSFQDAVFKILRNFKSNIPAYNNLSREQVNYLLEDAADKMQFVQSIYTRFLLLPDCIDVTYVPKGSTLPEWAVEHEHRALYYINKGKTLFLVAEPPEYISVVDVIAIVLSDILGSPSPLPFGGLFLCPEDSESALTDVLRICSENKGRETMRNNIDLLGKDILAQDARQVQLHPLRPFYMGEIVAWRSQNGEKLKYGRVPEDVRPSSGQALYRFGVEIAPGVIETLLSSQVFSFRSVSFDNEGSSVMLPDVNNVVSQNATRAQVPEDTRRDKITSIQVWFFLRYLFIFAVSTP